MRPLRYLIKPLKNSVADFKRNGIFVIKRMNKF